MIELFFFIIALVVGFYLIYKKIEVEKNEDFEDREN